jgi:hypothetical protein
MIGFWIKQISATGPEKPTASIDLQKGANVITGPSDTGKSYLFSIINYVLGRTTEPNQDIPEAMGYDCFNLTIQTHKDSHEFLLERKVNSNKINVSKIKNTDLVDMEVFNTRLPLANPMNISNFLLSLCDLKNSHLLKNRLEGKKQLLSFKNINQFTNISESRIITKSSPFYFTQNNANHILEQSMLSLILEGQDFSEVETLENNKTKETRISGKIEYIESQIIEFAKRREILLESIKEMEKKNSNLEEAFLREEITTKLNESRKLENELSDLLIKIKNLTDDKIYNQELINRFKILERLYLSDIDRLEFITEAEALTSQLPSKICPICMNPMDDQQIEHLMEIENFRQSINAESEILNKKIIDLKESIEDSESILEGIESSLDLYNDSIMTISDRNEKLQPEIQSIKSILDDFLELKKMYNSLEFIDGETENLYYSRDGYEKLKKLRETTDIENICDFEILKNLSSYIQTRLEKWNYEEKPKVIFDSDFKVFDIVISNKGRGSFGKGKRAISYTACLLGFLDYCINENKKFSNLIVLDSPLITFKDAEEDAEKDFDLIGLDESFFNDLSSTPKNSQIIIFENKQPPKLENLHTIQFSGNRDIGRFGFFPIS